MRGGHAVGASVLLASMAGMSSHAQSPADRPTLRAGTTLIELLSS